MIIGFIGKVYPSIGAVTAPNIPTISAFKMKIISGPILLSEGQIAYQLSKYPSERERADIKKWAIDAGIADYILLKSYYESVMMGDIDYPAIQVAKDSPDNVHSLTVLRWT